MLDGSCDEDAALSASRPVGQRVARDLRPLPVPEIAGDCRAWLSEISFSDPVFVQKMCSHPEQRMIGIDTLICCCDP